MARSLEGLPHPPTPPATLPNEEMPSSLVEAPYAEYLAPPSLEEMIFDLTVFYPRRSWLEIMDLAEKATNVGKKKRGARGNAGAMLLPLAADLHVLLRQYDIARYRKSLSFTSSELQAALKASDTWLKQTRDFMGKHQDALLQLIWGPMRSDDEQAPLLGQAAVASANMSSRESAVLLANTLFQTLHAPISGLLKQIEQGGNPLSRIAGQKNVLERDLVFYALDIYKRHFGQPGQSNGNALGPAGRFLRAVLDTAGSDDGKGTEYQDGTLAAYIRDWRKDRTRQCRPLPCG